MQKAWSNYLGIASQFANFVHTGVNLTPYRLTSGNRLACDWCSINEGTMSFCSVHNVQNINAVRKLKATLITFEVKTSGYNLL